jgi:hypothetical protein
MDLPPVALEYNSSYRYRFRPAYENIIDALTYGGDIGGTQQSNVRRSDHNSGSYRVRGSSAADYCECGAFSKIAAGDGHVRFRRHVDLSTYARLLPS